MADKLSPARRSANMSRIKSRDTKPEMVVRRMVHGMGYRYRLHRKDLPGKPDIVFGPRRKLIFVHGCFWHQHPDPGCLDGRMPKSRTEYWTLKLKRNVERDKERQQSLRDLGWDVLTIWECETKDPAALCEKLMQFLQPHD
jgi:DNA mismatch endonuclease (patch repair protein)